MRPLAHALSLAALLALPAVAQAHSATIACDLERPGAYVVVADYQRLDPVTTYMPTGAVVTWRDGYVVRLPYPAGCAVPEPAPNLNQPAPVVQVEPPNLNPGPAPAPPAVAPGWPVPMGRKAAPVKPRKVTCALLRKRGAGPREYWKRGWTYRCVVPVPPRKGRPFVPKVAG